MKRILILCFLIFGFNIFADDYLAKGIILRDGSILEGKNMDIKHPISSLTTLMSALVVADAVGNGEINLDDIVTVDRKTAGIGGKSIKLVGGEKLTLEELLCASLLVSANNATYVMATYVAGSEEEFVKRMNDKAKELGMNSSSFYTPSGMPPVSTNKEADISTVEDLSKLVAAVYNNKIIMDIISLKEKKIKRGRIKLKNENKLLSVEGVNGMKMAFYEESGYNGIISVERNEKIYILVLLGALSEDGRDSELESLIDYVFENYREDYLVNDGELIVEVPIVGGKVNNIYLYADKSVVNLVRKDWDLTKSVYLPKEIKAPIKKDEKVGFYVISYEGKEIAKVNLVSKEEVKKGNWLDKILKKLRK
jgi:D-alanyl-D-alanine carboxypeptidase (penicillin-binding protein 5/6)